VGFFFLYFAEADKQCLLAAAPNSHGWVNPRDVEEMWMDRFKFFYREYDEGFVYPVTVHPDVCGHPHGLMMLER
jgi:hypothetical protein